MQRSSSEELLRVRRPRFRLRGVPAVWDTTGAHKTSLINAFSFVAPVFEKAACVAVRECLPEIRNPRLLANARAFVQQEAQHSHVHTDLNEYLLGNGLSALRQPIDDLLAAAEQDFYRLPARQQLATVAAGEHIIACFSHWILEEKFSRSMHPMMRALYVWHSLEEVEHAALSYDVYHHIYGTGTKVYAGRVMGYLRAISYVMGRLLKIYLLSARILAPREPLGARLARHCLILYTAVMRSPPFLRYFSPLFHPDKLRPPRFDENRPVYEAILAPYLAAPVNCAVADRQ
jgi:predicted metal-dependent hydrolase